MRIGVIGDTHIPYCRKDYLEFCQWIFKSWRCKHFIHIGDLLDHHAMSFHDSEPSLSGPHGELVRARDELEPWFSAFPKLEIMHGNHDMIPPRKIKKMGIDPDVWMRPMSKVYGWPKGWSEHEEIIYDDVLFHHGITSNGINGARRDAQRRMMNTCSGHAHGNAGISAFASQRQLLWGCATGCGVDNESMAFAYGKHFLYKPINSCAVIIDGAPYVEYMDL